MYIYIYIYIYIDVYIYTRMNMNVYICVHMYVCICVYVYPWTEEIGLEIITTAKISRNFEHVFTGVLAHITQVFSDVPKIANTLLQK